jgi:CubicO group peptidase (beta-lactamase class C family)
MKKIASLLLFLLVLNNTYGQTTDLKLQEKIDTIINRYMKATNIVGISIGIIRNNKSYYTKGYGTIKLQTNKPVDSLTNFHAASISKLFTATAIMQLVEQSKLDINNKLIYYLPAFKMKDERVKDITLKQLLNHTSGIPDITDYNWEHPNNSKTALKHFVLPSRFSTLSFTPGTDIHYSNPAFDILGYIVERTANQSFEDYEYEKVLKPSGMTHSSFDLAKIEPTRKSSPHIIDSTSKNVQISKVYPFNKEHSPCGTLNTCSSDLSKWILEMLAIYNDSTNSYRGVIKRETLLQMWTPTHNIAYPGLFLCLAWWKRESKEYGNYFFHVGVDVGYSCSLTLFPDKGLGIVVLCNGDYPGLPVYRDIPLEIARLLTEKPH